MLLRLLTDFNDIEGSNVVTGLAQGPYAPRPPREGDRILLHDDGEHEALGVVTRVDGDLVSAAIDWSTWGDAGRYQARDFQGQAQAWWVSTNGNLGQPSSGLGGVRRPMGRRVGVGD